MEKRVQNIDIWILLVNMLTEQEAEEKEQLKLLYAASQLSSDI